MTRDLNKVQITGRLGANPTMRHTAHGSAITTFRVASNRVWRTSSGAAHEETEWFRVVAWDQLAELCQRSLGKGSHIYVEGRLQTRQWSENSGQARWSTELIASEVILLSEQESSQLEQESGLAIEHERPVVEPVAQPVRAMRMQRSPRNSRSAKVRPAAPPADLDPNAPKRPPLHLAEEDLPI